jgi:hypothetical protein
LGIRTKSWVIGDFGFLDFWQKKDFDVEEIAEISDVDLV